MKIQNRKISNINPPFIIAEIGINHNGNMLNVFRLIDYAVAAKCDAVKFQTFKADEIVQDKKLKFK